MPVREIPEIARQLLVERIDSVPELEAILLLRSQPDRAWTADELGRRLYVSVILATHVLARLAERGFLARTGDRYRYDPESGAVDAAVAALARAYATHLVAVTRLIHSKPAASVREFAAAFRLRKEP